MNLLNGITAGFLIFEGEGAKILHMIVYIV